MINVNRNAGRIIIEMETGNRLKELRESLGYSVDEFAKLLNVHRSSMYRYEGTNKNEQREIPMPLAREIAEKFNVSLDWLSGSPVERYRDQSSNKLIEIYESLSEDSQKELFNYATYLKSRES